MGLQDTFKSIANGSCLALCLAKLVEPEGTRDSQLMQDVIMGWRKSYIEDDGYVRNPEDYMMLIDTYHRKWHYKKVSVEGLEDIPEGKTVVALYSINGKDGHFVLATNKGIVWNSLEYSNNVSNGCLIGYREVWHD